MKAHVLCGVKTNVIVAAEILDRDAADCPQFPPMVNAAKQHFTIKETTADKAYLSNDNLNLVDEAGRDGVRPVQGEQHRGDGAVVGPDVPLLPVPARRFPEALPPAQQRGIGVQRIKRKFGDAVRSQTDTAMRNEVFCKFICNNICCVIMEQCVLGIEAGFWQDEKPEAGPADVLPMNRPG